MSWNWFLCPVNVYTSSSTAIRDCWSFYLIALPPSTYGFHLMVQDGCSSSCLHIHIPVGTGEKGSGGGHTLSLLGITQTLHTLVFIHIPLARFISMAILTSKRLKNMVFMPGGHIYNLNSRLLLLKKEGTVGCYETNGNLYHNLY